MDEDKRETCPECGCRFLKASRDQMNGLGYVLKVLEKIGFKAHLVRMYGTDAVVMAIMLEVKGGDVHSEG